MWRSLPALALLVIAVVGAPAAQAGTAPLGGGLLAGACEPDGGAAARVTPAGVAAGLEEPNVAAAYADALGEPDTLRGGVRRTGPATVPVYVHVIRGPAGIGAVPQATIDAQIDVLNDGFDGGATGGAGTGLRFELADTDVTVNSAWYPVGQEDAAAIAMKSSLHRGGRRALNLYVTDLAGDLLGYARFPSQWRAAPELDGVVVDNETLPGGTAPYDLGDTAVHEVGHWVGLFHTFQGASCSGPGDLVADTPAELEPHYTCDTTDSCPSDPGSDPVDNYMDYAVDSCMHLFTPGQAARIGAQVARYRNTSPKLNGGKLRVRPGRKVGIDAAASDAEDDAISYEVAARPKDGTLKGTAPRLTYKAPKRWDGKDVVKVRASDVYGAARTATYRLRAKGRKRR